MRTSLTTALGLLLFAAGARAAGDSDRYTVEDQGGFASTGRFVEFADRYGWQTYDVRFDFGFDAEARQLARKSTLELEITKTDGSRWSYRCKESKGNLTANINFIYQRGASIVTECRIKPEKFARAVGLDADMVGDPVLVFQVYVKDGHASVGVQKGLYFLAGGQIEASEMNQYATTSPDPSNLAVLFASEAPAEARHPYYQQTPRFVP